MREEKPGLAETIDGLAVAETVGSDPGLAATVPPAHADGSSPAPVDRGGRYRFKREIARGGMGRIVEAFDSELLREVAIKEVLQPHPDLIARFQREAVITARLQHPSIVPIYEVGERADGDPFYVMRFLRGQPLQAAIDKRKTVRARLELISHMTAAADAMAYAHSESIIHRDLKPLNVLVGEFGETMVIDWGLAKDLAVQSATDLPVGPYRSSASAAGETVEGQIFGTPAYMPPEQAAGEAVDHRADVYALGAMLHHVLAGEPPFGGRTVEETLVKVLSEPPRALPAEIPDDLRTIVQKAMAHEPANRYPTARELADDLRRWTSGRLVDAHQYSVSQLANRWMRKAWLPLALAAALIAAVIVAAVWIANERSRRRDVEVEDQGLRLENQRLWQERGGAATPLRFR